MSQLVRFFSAYKRKGNQELNDYYIYEDNLFNEYEGSGYAKTLNPLDVVIVRETFENAYQQLNSKDINLFEKNMCLNDNIDDDKDKRNMYRCLYKFRKNMN